MRVERISLWTETIHVFGWLYREKPIARPEHVSGYEYGGGAFISGCCSRRTVCVCVCVCLFLPRETRTTNCQRKNSRLPTAAIVRITTIMTTKEYTGCNKSLRRHPKIRWSVHRERTRAVRSNRHVSEGIRTAHNADTRRSSIGPTTNPKFHELVPTALKPGPRFTRRHRLSYPYTRETGWKRSRVRLTEAAVAVFTG